MRGMSTVERHRGHREPHCVAPAAPTCRRRSPTTTSEAHQRVDPRSSRCRGSRGRSPRPRRRSPASAAMCRNAPRMLQVFLLPAHEEHTRTARSRPCRRSRRRTPSRPATGAGFSRRSMASSDDHAAREQQQRRVGQRRENRRAAKAERVARRRRAWRGAHRAARHASSRPERSARLWPASARSAVEWARTPYTACTATITRRSARPRARTRSRAPLPTAGAW